MCNQARAYSMGQHGPMKLKMRYNHLLWKPITVVGCLLMYYRPVRWPQNKGGPARVIENFRRTVFTVKNLHFQWNWAVLGLKSWKIFSKKAHGMARGDLFPWKIIILHFLTSFQPSSEFTDSARKVSLDSEEVKSVFKQSHGLQQLIARRYFHPSVAIRKSQF